jgi:hypothetical protein
MRALAYSLSLNIYLFFRIQIAKCLEDKTKIKLRIILGIVCLNFMIHKLLSYGN